MNASTVHEQAVADERKARVRHRRLDKARRTKAAKRASEIWEQVSTRKRQQHCTCPIHRGMTLAELNQIDGCRRGYICPVLDFYRRSVGGSR